MRFVKPVLISIIVLFLMLTALSLLFPSHIRISRAINVAATREKTYAAISELRDWDQWNTFIRLTDLTGISLSSPSFGKGAFVRTDQLTISEEESSLDSVRFYWKQTKGRSFTNGFQLLQLRPDSLTVQCWVDFHFRWYPWEKLGSLVYDQQFGPVMEETLAGLRRYVEKVP